MIGAVSDEAVATAVEEIVQGSPEWHALRCGKWTASIIHPLVATRGDGKGRSTLIRTVVAERLTGIPQGFEGNEDTDFGHEHEPHARRLYQIRNGVFLDRVAFLAHPTVPMSGASPDGMRDDRGVEFKCHRKAKKFLELIEAEIPRAHKIQCQWGMACGGKGLWDYNNYCPEMPEDLRLHTRTIERDEQLIAELVVAIREGDREVEARVASIKSRS